MTVTEFKQREIGDVGMIRVNVKDHKTVSTYDSVQLMLYSSEFEWILMFINNVRSKISTINTNYVFISWNGNKMTPGDISGRLHNLWEKAGIFEDRVVPKKLCANIIRKSVSALVRQVKLLPTQCCTVSIPRSNVTPAEISKLQQQKVVKQFEGFSKKKLTQSPQEKAKAKMK